MPWMTAIALKHSLSVILQHRCKRLYSTLMPVSVRRRLSTDFSCRLRDDLRVLPAKFLSTKSFNDIVGNFAGGLFGRFTSVVND